MVDACFHFGGAFPQFLQQLFILPDMVLVARHLVMLWKTIQVGATTVMNRIKSTKILSFTPVPYLLLPRSRARALSAASSSSIAPAASSSAISPARVWRWPRS